MVRISLQGWFWTSLLHVPNSTTASPIIITDCGFQHDEPHSYTYHFARWRLLRRSTASRVLSFTLAEIGLMCTTTSTGNLSLQRPQSNWFYGHPCSSAHDDEVGMTSLFVESVFFCNAEVVVGGSLDVIRAGYMVLQRCQTSKSETASQPTTRNSVATASNVAATESLCYVRT